MSEMSLYQQFLNAMSSAGSILWGLPLITLLFGTHLYLSFRLRFLPQRWMFRAIRMSVQREPGTTGDISPFGALTTALAATVGTGNIIGVASAVAAGGPGAVLWMWLTGVFGIATKYSEALLAVKYRVRSPNGTMAGGPMYVLDRVLGLRWLAIFFALMTVVASFGIGNTVQSHSIASTMKQVMSIPPWVTGLVLMILTAVSILGGIKSIARVCQALVPFMAIFYVFGCVYLLIRFYSTLDDTIVLIFKSAFTGHAAVGGFVGATIKQALKSGIARGLFSNESGMGSAPIVAAAAQTRNPARQALISASGTFWDTVVICLMTGLVVVNAGDWLTGLKGGALTTATFGEIPTVGPIILTVGLLTFVFSTILGWAYYGEKSAEYLFGPRVILPYRLFWVAAVMIGAIAPEEIWSFADLANGMMAIPNLISVLLLSGVIWRETRKYLTVPGAIDMEDPDRESDSV